MGACVSSPQRAGSSSPVPAAKRSTWSGRHDVEVSEQLSAAAAEQTSLSVLSLVNDNNYLNPRNWTSNLDVPVIKCGLALWIFRTC